MYNTLDNGKNDMKLGEGKYYSGDGKLIYNGQWKNDVYITRLWVPKMS